MFKSIKYVLSNIYVEQLESSDKMYYFQVSKIDKLCILQSQLKSTPV